jgi:biopolymer transport protein ExbB/TolQ
MATILYLPLGADIASQALSGLAGALRVPVHVLAVLALAVLAFELGGLLMEAWRRVRPAARPVEQTARQAMANPYQAAVIARGASSPLTERAITDLAAAAQSPHQDATENALARYELRIQRKLDRTRILVRAGPALGLMGTLIPLAPGLSALGQGDYQRLASDLKSAFAATVVGILVGTGAYVLTLVRTRIYTEDLASLERAVAAHQPRAHPETQAHHRVEASIGGDAL